MYVHREICGFLSAIAQPHGRQHVTFGRDTQARTASKPTLMLYFIPKMVLGSFHLLALWVLFYLSHDHVDFFHFKVDNIIHDTLSQLYMFGEFAIIKPRLLGKGLVNIAVQV